MKYRLIDVALLVGLVLVAGAIVWTLFSLGRDPAPRPAPDSTAPTAEAPADPDDGGSVVPVAPGADEDDAAQGDAATDDAAAAGDDDGNDAAGDDAAGDGAAEDEGADPDAEAGEDDAEGAADAAGSDDDADAETGGPDRPDPEVPAAEAPPLPEAGEVALGRIGFSYVTGGAGACGIVLEPWTHVAVSRELLEAYGCGAEVRVEFDEEIAGRDGFDAVVADTMNPAFSRTVNVYVGEDEPAFQFGLTSGTIEPLE